MAKDKFFGKTTEQLQTIVSAAQDAFFSVVVKAWPKIKNGDFPTDAQDKFNQASEEAIRTWVICNIPISKDDGKEMHKKECYALALTDELLDTVTNKIQIPGSKIQVAVQAEAIKRLITVIEANVNHRIQFPDITDLLDIVVEAMPGCIGKVPDCYYILRKEIEQVLMTDPVLGHVVNVHAIRGEAQRLYHELPILKNPKVPAAVKEELLEDSGPMFVIGQETLSSTKFLIETMCVQPSDKEQMIAAISIGADNAKAGDKLVDAMAKNIEHDNKQDLQQSAIEYNLWETMQITAKADQILSSLFKYWLGQYYDGK
ncbi:MAG: hypothetical protein PHI12_14115 [Dehalococcoidales bacterium]|nr:hypothetical protein [Dehalococcoidales bacterium]